MFDELVCALLLRHIVISPNIASDLEKVSDNAWREQEGGIMAKKLSGISFT